MGIIFGATEWLNGRMFECEVKMKRGSNSITSCCAMEDFVLSRVFFAGLSKVVLVWTLIGGLPLLVVADRKDWFRSDLVEDFTRPSERSRVTPQKQEEMAKRRRGTYAVDLGDHSPFMSRQFGKEVRRLLIDIADDNRAKLFFECADGECVSSPAFLDGQMSDLSFLWKSAGQGLVAWYGVLGDYLTIAFCPPNPSALFVMKRLQKKVDPGKVRLVSSPVRFCDACEPKDDVFSMVCETEASARICRSRAKKDYPADKDDTVVAYYVRENVPGHSRVQVRPDGEKPLPFSYFVLEADGCISLIYGDGKSRFRNRPNFDYPWWDEFTCAPWDIYSTFYDVRRDEIVARHLPFCYSHQLDSRICGPRYFRSRAPGGQKTIGELLDETLAREYVHPQELFRKVRYKRLADTEANYELRAKLRKALKDFQDVQKRANGKQG